MTAAARVTAIREALATPDESTSRVTLKVRTYSHGEGVCVVTGEVEYCGNDESITLARGADGETVVWWADVLDAWFPSDDDTTSSTTRPMLKVWIVTSYAGDMIGIYEREEDAEAILSQFPDGQIDARRVHDQIAAEDHLRDLELSA